MHLPLTSIPWKLYTGSDMYGMISVLLYNFTQMWYSTLTTCMHQLQEAVQRNVVVYISQRMILLCK